MEFNFFVSAWLLGYLGTGFIITVGIAPFAHKAGIFAWRLALLAILVWPVMVLALVMMLLNNDEQEQDDPMHKYRKHHHKKRKWHK